MSIYETTIKNPKKIAEFYKQLSEQKDIEIKQLKEQLETSERARKEAVAYIKENSAGICYFDKEENRYKTNESKVLEILDIDK